MYAQIAGTRVDYGRAHSEAFRHARFGWDYSGCPLIPAWGPDTRLVLLGHSFGGATVRLFAELMANGDPDERAVPGEDLSPLFAGGLGSRIHSVVTLASPMNGTTAYDLFTDPDFRPDRVKTPLWSRGLARLLAAGTKPETDGRDPRDFAGYDMHIDNALAMNRRLTTLPEVY